MSPFRLRRVLPVFPLLVTALGSAAQQQPGGATATLSTVEVSGSVAAQRRFDAAASYDLVTVDPFRATTPLVNLSELVAGQPGVAVLDRGNYAQDLQIAVRGFGSRSTFGVRGVRILVDGIPATMPDGQGQAATAQLPSASQVELLRGPLAQQYGNAAGGVLQITTREPRSGGGATASVAAGSSGLRVLGASFDFGDRTLGGLIDVSHVETSGWRAHSAAERNHLNGKLVARPDGNTTVTTLVNLFDQPNAQDPLGLTRAQFDANPRQAPSVAEQFNTRKSVSQNQLGLVVDRRLGAQDSLRARVYGGTRGMRQYLSFAGDGASAAGGVVDLDRDYYGAGIAWTHALRLPSGLPASWTVGLDADRLAENRQGLVNSSGTAGALRRDERDRAGNTDLHAQADAWVTPTWRVIAGLRSTQVKVSVDDHYVTAANPDDSGSRTYRQTSPALGVVWSATDAVNVYANVGRGFETPTLAEMAYSQANSGPNYGLGASRSRQAELGVKWQGQAWGAQQRVQAAVFDARSRDEIVPAATVNGRTVYQNADRVRRRGAELAWSAMAGAWTPRAAFTWLDAAFGSDYQVAGGARVPAGNRLPGTARQTALVGIDYAASSGWTAGAEVSGASRTFANDVNTAWAPGYAVAALKAGYAFNAGGVRWYAWGRIDNLLDRRYAGSLIVNDGNSRFYEAAAGRRAVIGLRAQFL